MIETTTYNDEQMIKSLVQKTYNSPMEKNEVSNKLVLDIVFDEENDMYYIYKLLYNQEIFKDFRQWMDDALEKQVDRLQEIFLVRFVTDDYPKKARTK